MSLRNLRLPSAFIGLALLLGTYVTPVEAMPPKAGNSTTIKGGHSSNARSSTSDKHQAADAARKKQQDPQRKEYDSYKAKKGRSAVSFDSWKKGVR